MSTAKRFVTTISLPEREFRLLEKISEDKGMGKGHVIGHALRVLAALDQKVASGAKVYLEDELKNKAELVLL